ncbi:MAG: geranylgeranylglyceryl/heptaprenylglyceryl phosphate synthase [Thermoplasmata archaeon]|nr:geranylgeranylglyceryl/heptaprenylglyceryl phosphate synthase [Thermoplasmata archaeon]
MFQDSVYNYIVSKLRNEKIHMTLLDPAKMRPERIGNIGAMAQKAGTSAIMLGGSTHLSMELVDESVLALKKETSLPIILFPAAAATLSRHADALYFMSMLNSTDINYIVGEQVKGAPLVKDFGIEPIPMGYIIVEPGMAVGHVGKAKVIPRDDPELAMHYSLTAQYFGMKLVYLEAGSGASHPVPAKMVREVKQGIEIPLIVGGGIRTPKQAREIIGAGADIIVTGTVVEETEDIFGTLEPIIQEARNG